ncbi:MAG TPA: hypothetical protein VJ436_04945 [Anaerolineales bacterium]|nr:hypothetical protein [Anaerolineales bacterium]
MTKHRKIPKHFGGSGQVAAVPDACPAGSLIPFMFVLMMYTVDTEIIERVRRLFFRI